MLYQLSYASAYCPAVLHFVVRAAEIPCDGSRAGDGTRTRGHKLGRLVLYQLSYSRVATHVRAALRAALREARQVVGEGFEPSKGCPVRFTV